MVTHTLHKQEPFKSGDKDQLITLHSALHWSPPMDGRDGVLATAVDVTKQRADCVVSSVAVHSWHLHLYCSFLKHLVKKGAALLSVCVAGMIFVLDSV